VEPLLPMLPPWGHTGYMILTKWPRKCLPRMPPNSKTLPPLVTTLQTNTLVSHYGPGQVSPYGEHLLFATEYCGAHRCVTASHLSASMKEWAETFGGRQDSATKAFLETTVAGADDDQGKAWSQFDFVMLSSSCSFWADTLLLP
jgi:hypothetical protein